MSNVTRTPLAPSLLAILALMTLSALPSGASAQGVEVELAAKVLAGGKEQPSLTLVALEDVERARVELVAEGGKRLTLRAGPMAEGERRRFALQLAVGVERRYTGTLFTRVAGEDYQTALDFKAEIVRPALLKLDPSKVELAAQRAQLTSTRPARKLEVEVMDDRGREMARNVTELEDLPPGSPLPVSWSSPGEGRPMKITVRVHDPDGFYSGIELYPWRLEIPHEEVHFASGSAAVPSSEEQKLTDSLARIEQALEQFGRFAALKLFVVGHTDTVGKSEANRALSQLRARAICQHFKKRGLDVPLYYAGFGEELLAVETPDETPAEANRRAEYIVAIEPPTLGPTGRAAPWKKL